MNFQINIPNLLGGYAPGYWKSTYPTFGNNNQAAAMVNCDLTNPEYLAQGPGLATVTGTVTALMKGISNTVIGANSDAYGIGGTGIYKIEPDAVTNVYTIKNSTGWKFPTANAEPAAPYNGYQWTNPGNAYASDETFATADLNSTPAFQIYKTFDLASSVPDGATITGIECLIEGKTNTAGINGSETFWAKITKDGTTLVGDAKTTTVVTETNATYTLGGSNDMWGNTLTKADLTATFGVFISANVISTDITVSLDDIRLKIYYTPSSATGESLETITGSDLIYTHSDTKVGYTADLTTFYDDKYESLTSGAPHQIKVIPGSTIGFISDGYRILRFNYPITDLNSFSEVLVFTTDNSLTNTNITSIDWYNQKLWITANFPNFTGRKKAMLYSYNGSGDTYDTSIPIDGEVGVCYQKDGILYVIYKKNYEDGVCTLAYCDGYKLVDIADYYGSLPTYYQVSTYKDFLIWTSGTSLMAYGGGVAGGPGKLFQLGVTSTGGIANPFGTPVIAYASSLKKFSGYTVTSSWNSLLVDTTSNGKSSIITGLSVNFEALATGARCDITLKDNKGQTIYTGVISYADLGAATNFYIPLKHLTENVRVELNYANGSTTNTVQIKNIKIFGQES